MLTHQARNRTAKQRNRFAIWAWSPIIVLRVSLVSTYCFYVLAGLIGVRAGIPIFTLTAPQGYTLIWASILGIAALVAAIGSLSDRWHTAEKWAAMFLSAMLLTYVGALFTVGFVENDLGRQFIAVISAIGALLPVTRFVYLAAQSGKRHVELS